MRKAGPHCWTETDKNVLETQLKGPPKKAVCSGTGLCCVHICQIWAKHVIHTQTQNVYVYTNKIPFINNIDYDI